MSSVTRNRPIYAEARAGEQVTYRPCPMLTRLGRPTTLTGVAPVLTCLASLVRRIYEQGLRWKGLRSNAPNDFDRSVYQGHLLV